MHTLVLIHGINNRAEMVNWQDRVMGLMAGVPGVRVVVYKYGFALPLGNGVWRVGTGGWSLPATTGTVTLKDLAEDFVQFCQTLRVGSSQLSIAAHSFGTLVVTQALSKHLLPRPHRVLLAASVADRGFSWSNEFADAVRHEYTAADPIVKLVPAGGFCNHFLAPLGLQVVPKELGVSGLFGFDNIPQNMEQKAFTTSDHSMFVAEEHVIDYWFPFFFSVRFGEICAKCMRADNAAAFTFWSHYWSYIANAIGFEVRLAEKRHVTLAEIQNAVLEIWRVGANEPASNPSSIIRRALKAVLT